MVDLAKLRRASGLITLATIAGAVVGGVGSLLVVRIVVLKLGPIFWEGGEGFLPLLATLLAGLTGGLSVVLCSLPMADWAPIRKTYVGLCLGIGVGLAYPWVASGGTFGSGGAPKGMVFWSVVALATACGLAGLVAGLIVDAKESLIRSREWRFSARTLLVMVTLVAALLGLIALVF
jgi:hypothetical protein